MLCNSELENNAYAGRICTQTGDGLQIRQA